MYQFCFFRERSDGLVAKRLHACRVHGAKGQLVEELRDWDGGFCPENMPQYGSPGRA